MDNYRTHKTAVIHHWFAKLPSFHVHFTPTYGSWLSLVERSFAELTMKRIRRGAYRTAARLKAAIQAFLDAHHADLKPSVWTNRLTTSWRASRDLPSEPPTRGPRLQFHEPWLRDTRRKLR